MMNGIVLRMPREKYNEQHQNDGAAIAAGTEDDYKRGKRKKGYVSASSEPLAKKKNKGEPKIQKNISFLFYDSFNRCL